MIENLISDFIALSQVEAIALGGSRAGDRFDEKSDYDIYLYCTAPIAHSTRREILSRHCRYMEIGNHFWELEDNCTLNSGLDIDILYRNLDDFTADVASVVESHCARNGYTTCMWHNLKTCRILFDRNGRLLATKKRFDVPYPEMLRTNIIAQNRALLNGILPSYDMQILKAAERNDLVSVSHRVSAFLESYFDVLFAYNRQTHPGEKRLVQLCMECCPVLPAHFEENIRTLFESQYRNPSVLRRHLAEIIRELDEILH